MEQNKSPYNCRVAQPRSSMGRAKPFVMAKTKEISIRGKIKDHYYDWDGFSNAIKKLNIRSKEEYEKRFTEDPLLMENPERYIRGFPGWDKVFKNIDRFQQTSSEN